VNLTCPIYNGCNVVGSGTLAQAQASVGDGGAEPDATVAGQGGIDSGTGTTAPKLGATGGGGGGGCAASAPGDAGSGVGLGALAGILGLVVGRAVRVQRRRARSNG
jgi:hypothetical protein